MQWGKKTPTRYETRSAPQFQCAKGAAEREKAKESGVGRLGIVDASFEYWIIVRKRKRAGEGGAAEC